MPYGNGSLKKRSSSHGIKHKRYMTLVPRKKNLEKVNDYRSIILCSVSYKFILLANRVLMVLPNVISSLQSAFPTNRDTHDSILSTYEILTTFSKKCNEKAYMALLEEDYDRLEWDFIKTVSYGLIGLFNA